MGKIKLPAGATLVEDTPLPDTSKGIKLPTGAILLRDEPRQQTEQVSDVMAKYGIDDSQTENQKAQQNLLKTFEAKKQKHEDDIHTAATNTAKLYFENRPLELKGFNLSPKKSKDELSLSSTGKQDKFSLTQLKNIAPFQQKVAELKNDIHSGKLITYPDNTGQLKAARPKDKWDNFTSGVSEAWHANEKVNAYNKLTGQAKIDFLKENKPDKEYLPEKTDENSASYTAGSMIPMTGKMVAAGATGAVMAAAVPETAGFSTAGLPALLAWASVVPDMAKQGQMNAEIDAFHKVKDANPDIKDEDALKIAEHAGVVGYAEGLATGTAMSFLGQGSIPANTGQGLWKAAGQFLRNQPQSIAEISTLNATGSVLGDEAKKALGVPITSGEMWDKAGKAMNSGAIMQLAFNVAHGVMSAPKFVKAQANEVLTKVNPETLQALQEEAVKEGVLTPEQVAETNTSLQDYKAARAKIPESQTHDEERTAVIAGLIQKKTNLEKAKTNVDKSYHKEIDEQIESANQRIELAKNSSDPIKYAESDDLDGSIHFTPKAFTDLTKAQKEGVEIPKDYGIAEVEEHGEGENKTYTPKASYIVEQGGLKPKKEITIEGEQKFKDKSKAQDAADNALREHYYENGLQDNLKPEKKSAITVIKPSENKVSDVVEKAQPLKTENTGTVTVASGKPSIEEHAQNIKDKFRQEFKAKGNTDEHIDGALALMDARAKSWASEEKGRTPEQWYQQIADVKNGDFQSNDVQYQNSALKAAVIGATMLHSIEANAPEAEIKFEKTPSKTEQTEDKAFSNEIQLTPAEIKNRPSFKIEDNRNVDEATGLKISNKNRQDSKVDSGLVRKIVLEANRAGVDPYTALAIGLQETGLTNEWLDNPLQADNPKQGNVIRESINSIKEKIKYAESIGKKTEAEKLQAWNGYGKISTKSEFGGHEYYGIDVSKKPLDLAKDPIYGKRIIDLRDNVLKRNPEIIKIVESESKNVSFQGNKGALETLRDGRVIIHALDSPDFSTMVHEIAHVFEKDLTSEEVKIFNDSEVFARGFERYLRDGSAPSTELKTLFEKFKDWLTNVYQSLKGSPIEKKVSPELKQVFDRLLTEKKPNETKEKAQELLPTKDAGVTGTSTELNKGAGEADKGEIISKPTEETIPEKTIPVENIQPTAETKIEPVSNGIHVQYPPTSLDYKGTGKIETEFGIEERPETVVKHDLETMKEADNLLEKGWDVKKVLASIENNEHTPSDAEHINLVRYAAELSKRLREIKDVTNPDYDKTLNELNRVAKASNVAGKEQGRALGIRGRYRTVAEGSYEDFMLNELNANNDAPLTDNQKETALKEFTNLQKEKANFEDKSKVLEDAVAKDKAAKEFENTKKTTKKDTKKTHEQRVADRRSAIERLKAAKEKQENFLKEQGIQKMGVGFTLTVEMVKEIKNIVKSYVEEGFDKLEDVVKNVFADTKDVLEGLTERQIHDVIAGEYNEKKITKSEAAKTLEDLRLQAGLMNRLERLLNGTEPKTEKEKIKRNQEVEKLRNQISDYKKEEAAANKFYGESEAGNKRIEKLEDELQRLKDRKEKEPSEKSQREISDKEKDLKEQIAAERKAIADENKEANTFYKEEKDATKAALQSLKNKNQKETERIKEKINKGDFSPDEKKIPLLQDAVIKAKYPVLFKDAQKSRDALIKAKNEIELRRLRQAYLNRTPNEKFTERLTKGLNVPRTIMASMDFSAPLRQGLVASISHPELAAKAIKFMFEATKDEKVYNRWLDDVHGSERWDGADKSGLGVTDPATLHIKDREEAFLGGEYAERIPGIGKLIKGSERAYVGFLNKLRWDLYNQYADAFEAKGKTVDNHPELYKGLASFINSSTGRGGMAFGEAAAPLMSSVLFSPRLIASRMNMLGLTDIPNLVLSGANVAAKGVTGGKFNPDWHVNYGFYSGLPKEIRIEAAKDMLKFISVGLTTLALAKYGFGASVEDDPRSSDFGKIKSGNTRWDIWGGFQPYARVLTQVVMGQTKSTNTGKIYDLDGKTLFSKDRTDPLTSFARGKLAPVPSAAWDLIKGRDIVGQDVSVSNELLSHMIPLVITDVYAAMKDKGISALFTAGIPSIFGVGVQTYNAPKLKLTQLTPEELKEPAWKEFNDRGLSISNIPNKFENNNKDYPLTDKQKDEYAAIMKPQIKLVLSNVVNSSEYKSANEDIKKRFLKKAYSIGYDNARGIFLSKHPEFQQ